MKPKEIKNQFENQLVSNKTPAEKEAWLANRALALKRGGTSPKTFAMGSGGAAIPLEEALKPEERDAIKERVKDTKNIN